VCTSISGIKAAQQHVRQRKGGIIWHTQGAGKSILMVLLGQMDTGKQSARAGGAIVTDRDELDKQIEGVLQEMPGKPFTAHQQRPRSDDATGASHAAFVVFIGTQVRPQAMSDDLMRIYRNWNRNSRARPSAKCLCLSMNVTAPRAANCIG
jgi:hypothetical protein